MLAINAYASPPAPTKAPRTVQISNTAAPPIIRVMLNESTLLELPPEEKVATVFGGNTQDWIFSAGHVASRFVSVKPKAEAAKTSTNVHIISDHGNEYTLELQEVSGDPNASFDMTVFLVPADKDAQKKMGDDPVFVPVAEVKELEREVTEVKSRAATEHKEAQDAQEKYASTYPGNLHFDYRWDHGKAKALGVRQIWDDGKFTYIQGKFEEPPVVYELKDKKGSLINFDFANGLYTVPKLLQNGYVAIGKAKVEFHREVAN
nr:TrbG/VirB9 family P-type conjugative transfer protein [Edaphobacter lichenicola]